MILSRRIRETRRWLATMMLGIATIMVSPYLHAADSLEALHPYSNVAMRSKDSRYLAVTHEGETVNLKGLNIRRTGIIVRLWDVKTNRVVIERLIYNHYPLSTSDDTGIREGLYRDGDELAIVYMNEKYEIMSCNVRTGVTRDLGLTVKEGERYVLRLALTMPFLEEERYEARFYDLTAKEDVSAEFTRTGACLYWLHGLYCVPLDTTSDAVTIGVYSMRTRQLQRTVETAEALWTKHHWRFRYPFQAFIGHADSVSYDVTNILTGLRRTGRYDYGILKPTVTVNGKYLLFVNNDKTFLALTIATGKIDTITTDFRQETVRFSDSLGWIQLSKGSDDFLAYNCRDTIALYNLEKHRPIRSFRMPPDSNVAFSWSLDIGSRYFIYDRAGHAKLYVDTMGRSYVLNDQWVYIDRDAEYYAERNEEDYGIYRANNRRTGIFAFSDPTKSVYENPQGAVVEAETMHWSADSNTYVVYQVSEEPNFISRNRYRGQLSSCITDVLMKSYPNGTNISPLTGSIVIVTNQSVFHGHVDSLDRIQSFDHGVERISFGFMRQDNAVVAVAGRDSLLCIFSGPGLADKKVFRTFGRVRSVVFSPDGSKIALSTMDSAGSFIRVFDSTMTNELYNMKTPDVVSRFSPTSRYLLTFYDIIDTRTWKSVNLIGGDYNTSIESSAFIDGDRWYARSTKDFGIYLLNLTDMTKSRYENYFGKTHFSLNGAYAWVVDSTSKLTCIRTSDWKVLSSIDIPYGITGRNVWVYGDVYPHPSACAVGFKNSLRSFYIWYPLTSTVTSVPEEPNEPTHALRGDPQAVSIRCRNGSAQLVVETEPETNSLRVVDVLGREVAFTMENRTLRLVNCRPGYHAITYRHAGHSVNIPVMVVEE